MHEGSTNPRLKQELRSATDPALRAREVAAQSLGKAMSTFVVQEHRLWLCRAERSELPGLTVRRHCRGLCPAVLGSTEADRGNTSCPGVMHRSAAEQDPVCLSLWAPSCVLQSCSAPCWIVGRRVEPLAGARRPLCSSWPRYRPERR